MPLNKSRSKAAFSENVATERAAGKPIKQALAIAYRVGGGRDRAMAAEIRKRKRP